MSLISKQTSIPIFFLFYFQPTSTSQQMIMVLFFVVIVFVLRKWAGKLRLRISWWVAASFSNPQLGFLFVSTTHTMLRNGFMPQDKELRGHRTGDEREEAALMVTARITLHERQQRPRAPNCKQRLRQYLACLTVPACNPSTQEVEVRGSGTRGRGQPGLHSRDSTSRKSLDYFLIPTWFAWIFTVPLVSQNNTVLVK